MLRDVYSLYNPLGFINPVIILAKVLLQKIWELGYAWDDKLNSELVEEWHQISLQIDSVIPKRFDRWLGIKEFDNVSLHIFADAGKDSCLSSMEIKSSFVGVKGQSDR